MDLDDLVLSNKEESSIIQRDPLEILEHLLDLVGA